MQTRVILMLLLSMAGSLSYGQHEHPTATAIHQSSSPSEPIPDYMKGEPGVIVGFVRDIACLVRNKKATVITDDESRKCVADCARSGSPLAILTKSGELYLPISAEIPDGTRGHVLSRTPANMFELPADFSSVVERTRLKSIGLNW
jgi:hypothetical protein